MDLSSKTPPEHRATLDIVRHSVYNWCNYFVENPVEGRIKVKNKRKDNHGI